MKKYYYLFITFFFFACSSSGYVEVERSRFRNLEKRVESLEDYNLKTNISPNETPSSSEEPDKLFQKFSKRLTQSAILLNRKIENLQAEEQNVIQELELLKNEIKKIAQSIQLMELRLQQLEKTN